MFDKKYRDTIPPVLKELPFDLACEADGISAMSMNKVRRSKKLGLRKNALYPNEEANLTRWWFSKDTSSLMCDTDEAREGCLRLLLDNLKARETQLQIILILEILSLEAMVVNNEEIPNVASGAPRPDGRAGRDCAARP